MTDDFRPVRTESALVNFSTRSAHIADEQMRRILGASTRISRWEMQPGFSMRTQIAKVGALTLAKTECANLSMAYETRDDVTIVFPLSGTLHLRRPGYEQVSESLKHGAVARPFESIVASVVRGAKICLIAPAGNLAARAESLTGKSFSPAKLTRIVDQIDATTPAALALAGAMKAAMTDAANLNRAGLWAFASNGYEELLSTLSIAALFPEVAARTDHPVPDFGPVAVHRAREYIHENAHLPIEISRLANELGVSMRALQANFQRYLGLSPRNYLLECRLEMARRRLLATEQAQSVTEIAYACGFGDLSHFSTKYRDKFGELPSETLRNAQRQVL
jgi:AraC-like DNA-binding protein